MEFSEKTWLMIILKFTKKAGFHSLSLSLSLFLEKLFLEKPQRRFKLTS